MPNFKLTLQQQVTREIDVTVYDVATEQDARDEFMKAFEKGAWQEGNDAWYYTAQTWPDVTKVEVVP